MTDEQLNQEEMLQKQKEQCPFCKIIRGEIPAAKVYEDDTVLAVSDINPLAKGHILVLPKEHYPIMPLIPPEVFDKLFSTTKYISKGVKDAIVTDSNVIYIANGGAAGQMSPHFLFHIIPREQSDGITNFDFIPKDVSTEGLIEPFKTNLEKIMQPIAKRSAPVQQPQTPPEAPKKPSEAQPKPTEESTVSPERKKELAQYLEDNEDMKELLITNPNELAEKAKSDPVLQALFEGINIQVLSDKLNKAYGETQ
ncbi:MAG: histidine triad (HIT) family protein [Candidatus Woesearchaeota archaeon]|jgi:histidine triad (HIT) family protein